MMNPISSHPKQLAVWIIILNWNGLDDTLACLESISQVDISHITLKTVVIDNGSNLDPSSAIKARFPDIMTVRLPKNLGFASGCNYGMSLAIEAQADYVLLLNNDTIVDPDFLQPLVNYLCSNPDVGIVAPLICYADSPEVVWFAGADINFYVGSFKHRYWNRSKYAVPDEPIESDFVTGCCMLIPIGLIETIGMFDEQLFAYCEDLDFCIRARYKGFKSFCLPESLIWHKESSSTRRGLGEGQTSAMKHYLSTRNRIVMILRYANGFQKLFFLLVANPCKVVLMLLAFTLRRRWKKLAWFWRGVIHGLRRKFENTFA